jgi:hypothetical protein
VCWLKDWSFPFRFLLHACLLWLAFRATVVFLLSSLWALAVSFFRDDETWRERHADSLRAARERQDQALQQRIEQSRAAATVPRARPEQRSPRASPRSTRHSPHAHTVQASTSTTPQGDEPPAEGPDDGEAREGLEGMRMRAREMQQQRLNQATAKLRRSTRLSTQRSGARI